MNNETKKEGVEPSDYFCVVDPHGLFVHPTISLKQEEAINQWLETERACNIFVNAGRASRGELPRCVPSWEQYEAEGYRVLPVRLEVISADNA